MFSPTVEEKRACFRAEVLAAMDDFFLEQLTLLKDVKDSWQPSDFLPLMSGEGAMDEVRLLRERAAGLSDEVLVVLVGNLVTEEALPSYQTWLNRIEELADKTGADATPWALWTRGWTAEENRHGDVLSRYLYLTGRVDMRAVDVTVQNLIRNGFDTKSGSDPYSSIVYASFQERATKISHVNAGRLADAGGDSVLSRVCAAIGGDEARHEEAYKRFFKKILEVDPSEALLAFEDMMRRRIAMPARLMDDAGGHDAFEEFALVVQRAGVYTTLDYADITEHLVGYWQVATLTNLTPEAAAAQETLCGLADRYRSKAGRIAEVVRQKPRNEPFPWIHNRTA